MKYTLFVDYSFKLSPVNLDDNEDQDDDGTWYVVSRSVSCGSSSHWKTCYQKNKFIETQVLL